MVIRLLGNASYHQRTESCVSGRFLYRKSLAATPCGRGALIARCDALSHLCTVLLTFVFCPAPFMRPLTCRY